ncbi:MAG: tetratricopeptide repeat protein [Candidatus Thioglobus sp.]|jgi:predicted negative regulator of RcsB-dependent stress response|nr:tetratricopeptide repeat protein [Candidatus Thioglobus sp.]MBT4747448.1 tetratricopeptide repeat protein [Candidatus Thioglobus sp.]MBT6278761.1 tetratricopeptide repeat protein [Candidatus Thioglobus sp.]MBT6360434.1 tetratricopeptide repeat protein [Candidatus Thioglobus sp.]MBT7295494.1 tetratricopeptide repeat protein [Candidatus Thioglobus sp.]
MKNFIEIGETEDEQAQQIKKWLKDNSLQIIVGIALGLGGIWGLGAYKTYQQQQSVEARSLYLNTTSANNEAAFDALSANHTDSGYTQQAILMLAKSAVKKQDYESALQHLSGLVNAENDLIAIVATMRMATIQLEMGKFKQAIETLNGKNPGEFNGLYSQLKGDIYTANNQIEKAKEHYKLALSQISKDSELQSLISIKLADLN